MLETLFGSKNIERILLFLFVNNSCYGTGLQKIFQISLTPIQKAFARLEGKGIIISQMEGKTRIYRFNPGFPLLEELEALLKKSYTLLSPSEKKQYHFTLGQSLKAKDFKKNNAIILQFWDRLKTTSKLSLTAHAKGKWERKGYGVVNVKADRQNRLIFEVKGVWSDRTHQIEFTDSFRWSLDPIASIISLEHLRYGIDKPVFLFHLAPCKDDSLSSVGSHLCGKDSYFGHIHYDPGYLKVSWRVIGPAKNEQIDYIYT